MDPYLEFETEDDELTQDQHEIMYLNDELKTAWGRVDELENEGASSELDDYQDFTATTAQYPVGSLEVAVSYLTLGLTSEAGEVAGKVKKILRDDAGYFSGPARNALAGEIGDVFWYATRLADELGFSLEEIVALNRTKLASRLERGVIGGSGDQR